MRRGYGVEAGKLISYYGVDVLGVRRIEAKAYAYNVLSMNALRRNGFKQEGVLRQAGFDGTRYWTWSSSESSRMRSRRCAEGKVYSSRRFRRRPRPVPGAVEAAWRSTPPA